MASFYKIENGVVVQKQPYEEPGFISGPDDVLAGYTFDGSVFSAPAPDISKIKERKLKELRTYCRDLIHAVYDTEDQSNMQRVAISDPSNAAYLDMCDFIDSHRDAYQLIKAEVEALSSAEQVQNYDIENNNLWP